MEEVISIQSKWTSPDGKVVMVTTPEGDKYHCYKLPLFQHLVISEIEAEVKEYNRPAKGQYPAKHIKEVVNVKVNGAWILKEEQPTEPKGKEPAPGAPEPQKKAVKEATSILHQIPEPSDPVRKSIERQTALKAATEIAVARIAQGKEFKMAELLTAAKLFESYLESGVVIEEKKPVETKPKVT